MANYAFSDIHGNYNLWEQIKNYCKPEDTIYFLGDAIDRGQNGVKIMKELIEDPRVIYIKGNHEYIMERYFLNPTKENLDFWDKNGGIPTQQQLCSISKEEIINLLEAIQSMPYYYKYINTKEQEIFLSHSGFYAELDKIKESDKGWYKLKLLQDREHIEKPESIWFHASDIDYIIHGHTPTKYFKFLYNKEIEKDKPAFYGHKIDIDIGTYENKKIVLFNLDDFSYKIFEGEDFTNENTNGRIVEEVYSR